MRNAQKNPMNQSNPESAFIKPVTQVLNNK